MTNLEKTELFTLTFDKCLGWAGQNVVLRTVANAHAVIESIRVRTSCSAISNALTIVERLSCKLGRAGQAISLRAVARASNANPKSASKTERFPNRLSHTDAVGAVACVNVALTDLAVRFVRPLTSRKSVWIDGMTFRV